MSNTTSATEATIRLDAAFKALQVQAEETETIRRRRTATNAYTGPGASHGTYTEPTAAADRAINQRQDILACMSRIVFGD